MVSDYSIAVDERTRSLIVRADLETQAAIRQILEILDQTPQLLAVDLIITEVRTPRFGLWKQKAVACLGVPIARLCPPWTGPCKTPRPRLQDIA